MDTPASNQHEGSVTGESVPQPAPRRMLESFPARQVLEPVPDATGPYGGFPDARAFLESYWGADWPSVEAELIEMGLLERIDRLDMAKVPGWEVAREALRERSRKGEARMLDRMREEALSWARDPARLGVEFAAINPEHRVLGDSDLAEVQALANTYGEAIERALEEYRIERERVVAERWAQDGFPRHPVYWPKFESPPLKAGDVLEQRMLFGRHWCLRIVLLRADHPTLARCVDRILELRSERDEQARALIASLR